MDGERSLSSASNVSNEDHEYVWDGFTQQDDQLVAITHDNYYEDLELAARLGQTLLQRNKELDTLNYQLVCSKEEQRLEIKHLNKQLAWLREVNESKNRMCEQLDVNYQELEAINRKMKEELRHQKEKLAECVKLQESQDDQIQSLTNEMEALRKLHDGKNARARMRRRTIHVCLSSGVYEERNFEKLSGTPVFEYSATLKKKEKKAVSASVDESITTSRETIRKLKAQQMMDNRLIEELRRELCTVSRENQDFCERLQEERELTQRLNRIIEEYDKIMHRQAFVAESSPNISAELLLHNSANFTDCSGEEEILDRRKQTANLQGNTTPNQTVGNKSSLLSQSLRVIAPLSPYLRIASSTPLTSPTALQDPSGVEVRSAPNGFSKQQKFCVKSEPQNVSLVQEMDTQYKTLLGKYEMLLQSIECERIASPAGESQSKAAKSFDAAKASCVSESSFSSDESRNTSRPRSTEASPEYKRLFRELFSMINEAKACS